MTTLGAIYLPQNQPGALRDVARAADEAGLEELWLWEDCFLAGGVSAAAAALAWTERLRVGVGIMPVPLRNVAVCAMELSGLAGMFGDRVLPGIGHGVQDWMGQVGVRPASPLTLLREYATALRSLVHGETVTVDGRYVRLDGVRLDHVPATPPPIYVAGGGPKTIALAGQVGDGTVLAGGTSPAMVAETVRGLPAGDPHEVVVFVLAVTGDDAAGRLARAAADYRQEYAGLSGSADEIAAGVREFAAAGATRVILQPPPDEPDVAAYMRWVAGRIRPLVD